MQRMAHLRAGQELKYVQDGSLAREKDKKIEIMQLMNLFKEIKIMLQRDWDDVMDGPLEGRTGIPKQTPTLALLEPEPGQRFQGWNLRLKLSFHDAPEWGHFICYLHDKCYIGYHQLFRSTLYHDSPHWWDFEFVQPIMAIKAIFYHWWAPTWRAECDEYIRIFEYISHEYIFGHSFVSNLLHEYIRTLVRVKFVCTNIFGHSFVSVLECKN